MPKRLTGRLLAGSALSIAWVACATAGENPTANSRPEQVLIEGQRPEDYKIDVPALSKLTEPLVDTPQSIDVISSTVLKDRAVTNLNDALRNVPGISLGAGEFMWQGNNPSIRGFVARTDMFLDGMRDFGSYYRDPFNLEQIEVLEGPSSILFGRGSTGGVINQVSKRPIPGVAAVSGTLIGGTDSTRRATLDVNEPIDSLGPGAAFRVTAMGHESDIAGRDVGAYRRFGFASSLALGLGTPTRLTASYFHQTEDDIPDYGLPWFLGRPAPVPRQTFYGFKTDFLHTDADIGTINLERDLGVSVTARDQLRYAVYGRDFFTSQAEVPSSVTSATPLSAVMVNLNEFSGNSRETMLQNQADLTAKFTTGLITHALVAGFEIGRETSSPLYNNSANVPPVSLLNPDSNRPFSGTTFPREKTTADATSIGVYAIDSLKLGEQWELIAGIRWDRFSVAFNSIAYSLPPAAAGVPIATTTLNRTDQMPSYRSGLVYKPAVNGSIYFDYGTSFNPSAETLTLVSTAHTSTGGFPTGNAFLAPETNRTFELGTKWNLLNNQLAFTGALFRLEKQNARVPDPNNPGFNILEGTQRVDGFDLQVTGRITEEWQITAGYAYLDSHVIRSAPGAAPAGSPLVNAPKDALTFFTEYRLGGGFEIGGGGQYVSARLARNSLPYLVAPGYWTFDAMAKYDVSETMSLQLNVNNIFDRVYYDQLHPFHVAPGAGRTALLSLNFSY